jgi:hypothetical protein
MTTRFERLQQRLRDPLLTLLAAMLLVLLFVVGPIQAAGVVTGQEFGFLFGFVLHPAAFQDSRDIPSGPNLGSQTFASRQGAE